MTEKKNVKELKDLLDFMTTLVNVGLKAGADGKYDVADIGLLMMVVPTISPAFDGIKEIPAELADLSAEESGELVAHVVVALAITDAHAKAVVEQALKTAACLYGLVKAIKEAPVAV